MTLNFALSLLPMNSGLNFYLKPPPWKMKQYLKFPHKFGTNLWWKRKKYKFHIGTEKKKSAVWRFLVQYHDNFQLLRIRHAKNDHNLTGEKFPINTDTLIYITLNNFRFDVWSFINILILSIWRMVLEVLIHTVWKGIIAKMDKDNRSSPFLLRK